jgi:hypothetical protein
MTPAWTRCSRPITMFRRRRPEPFGELRVSHEGSGHVRRPDVPCGTSGRADCGGVRRPRERGAFGHVTHAQPDQDEQHAHADAMAATPNARIEVNSEACRNDEFIAV